MNSQSSPDVATPENIPPVIFGSPSTVGAGGQYDAEQHERRTTHGDSHDLADIPPIRRDAASGRHLLITIDLEQVAAFALETLEGRMDSAGDDIALEACLH